MASSSNVFEGTMFERGDLDLNFSHSSRGSFDKTLKKAKLNQELVLRRQGEFMQFENFDLRYELHQQSPVFMRKPLDLQLSADEFISQCVDDSFAKVVVTGDSRESNLSKNSVQNKVVSNLNHPNLSLGVGQDAWKMGVELRSGKGKSTWSSSIDIIDLEDPNLSFSNYESYFGLTSSSAAPKSCFRDKHKLDGFLKSGKKKLEIFPHSVFSDRFYGNTPCKTPVDNAGSNYQTQSLCDSGSNGVHRKRLWSENQRSPACKINDILELNPDQYEHHSYLSNNHSLVNSSISSSSLLLEKVYPMSYVASSVSPYTRREANKNSLMEMQDIRPQKDVKSEDNKGDKCNKDTKFQENIEANISIVDLNSDSFEELYSKSSDANISSVGSLSKISNGLSCEMDMVDAIGAEENLEKVAEPFVQLKSRKLSSSSESGVIDHHSSSIMTMQSGVQYDDNNFITSHGEKINTGSVTKSEEQDLRSSGSTESDIQCIIRKEPGVDGTVQIAAELLVRLSSETGSCCQIEFAKMPLKKFQKEDDQPQRSSESYEAMVLKAEESSPDDYCVSSNAFLVDESDKKDIMYKLKRGTRMKDFQKDIFPGLSTLSRQEIQEDINILEGVIRSREYKKMRAKMGDGGSDWCRSRGKRSRVSRR